MTGSAPLLAVVGDDLTGTAAVAGELAALGLDVVLARQGAATASRPAGRPCEVLAVDTASRYLPPDEASARVRSAVREIPSATRFLMKKIDSALRGNTVAELGAIADPGSGPVVVAAACPSVGLGTRDGRQFGPAGAVADLIALLHQATGQPVGRVALDTVARGAATIAVECERFRQLAAAFVVADCMTDDDLASVAAGALDAGLVRFAGTYGLGRALTRAIRRHPVARRSAEARPAPVAAVTGPLRIVVGSSSPVVGEQVSALVAAGADLVEVDPLRILAGDTGSQSATVAAAANRSDDVLVVYTVGDRSAVPLVTQSLARTRTTQAGLAAALAPVLLAGFGVRGESHLVCVGGETAGAVADWLGLGEFAAVGEVGSAVAVLRPDRPGPILVTKPGAFGDDSCLVHVADRLRHWR